jgi:hypothetical protein
MKYYTLAIIILVTLLPLVDTAAADSDAPKQTISGTLKQGETEEGESYLFIEVPEPLSVVSESGEKVESSQIQLAGLLPDAWKQAFELLDEPVSITGRPMPAMTRHHHTPVLWLCEEVEPDDESAKK